MGRVAAQVRTLAQRLADQTDVALFEVTHTAVNELRRAARRRFGKIGALHERRAITAGHGVERGPYPGRAAADDEYVERAVELREQAGARHRQSRFPQRRRNWAVFCR